METVLVYLLIGAVAGTLSGLFGIGGGLVVVPALGIAFYETGMPQDIYMHMAVGTSLAVMIFNAGVSLYLHKREGASVWPIYRKLFPGVVIGTVLGALVAHQLPAHLIRVIFGLLVLIVGLHMFFTSSYHFRRQLPGPWVLRPLSLAIGAKSGLLGVGGGVITLPFLLFCNVPKRDTVAITAANSLTVAAVGTISFLIITIGVTGLPPWSTGYIYWPAFAGIVVASPFFARIGTWMSGYLPVKLMKRFFSIFLLAEAVKMLIY